MFFAGKRRKKKIRKVTKPVFGNIFRRHFIISIIIAAVFYLAVIGVFSVQYLIHCREYAYDLSLEQSTRIYQMYHDMTCPNDTIMYEEGREYDHEAIDRFIDVACIDMLRVSAEAQNTDRIPFAFRLLNYQEEVVADSMELTGDEFVEIDRKGFLDVRPNGLHSRFYDQDYYRLIPDISEDAINTFHEFYDEYFTLRDNADLNDSVPMLGMDMSELMQIFQELNSDEKEIPLDIIVDAYIDGSYLYPSYRIELNGEIIKSQSFFPEDTDGMIFAQDIGDMFYGTYFEDLEIPDYVIETLDNEKVIDYFMNFGVQEKFFGDTLVYSCRFPFSGYYDEMYSAVFAFPCSFVKSHSVQVIIFAVIMFLAALLIAYIFAKNSFEERNAEYELHKQRQEMTRAIAHDLKTPMTSLAGYSDLLMEKDVNPEKHKHYLEMIPKTIEQMNLIISEVFEFSKEDTNRMVLTKEQINIGKLCHEIVENMKGTFDKADLKCEIEIDKEYLVYANRHLMHQALSNLIQNAAVHSKPGTTVRISLDRRIFDADLCISNVPDKMPGLPVEELLKPFVKGDEHRGENSGSGVGLAVAKEDLELMGYKLEIVIEDGVFRAVCVFAQDV